MTRFTLSVATVLFAFATLLASAANACISCNYRPEVADTPVGPPKKAKPQRPAAATVKRPAKNVAKRPRPTPPAVAAPRAPATETAKAPEPEADTGKTTPIEGQTGAESAGDTTAALSDDHGATANDPPPASTSGGCRKFSATAGTTVSVPCE